MFEAFWRQGLLAYDELRGIDWEWLSCDGLMGKAPLGGEETGPIPCGRFRTDEGDRIVKLYGVRNVCYVDHAKVHADVSGNGTKRAGNFDSKAVG